MSTADGNIVIERQVGDNHYIDDTLEGARDLLNSYNGDNVNGVTVHTYSRTAKNEATGEVILVTSNNGDNETVDHIINSIIWGNNTVKANESNGTVASVNNIAGNSNKQFTKEDLDKARDEGYWNGMMIHIMTKVNIMMIMTVMNLQVHIVVIQVHPVTVILVPLLIQILKQRLKSNLQLFLIF